MPRSRTSKLIDETMQDILKKIHAVSPSDDDYTTAVENLARLHALKQNEKSARPWNQQGLQSAFATVVSVLIIVGFERTHLVTSKALTLLRVR
jgi:hypothetical protein